MYLSARSIVLKKLDVTQPPFVPGTGSPEEVARIIIDQYGYLDTPSFRAVEIWRACAGAIGFGEGSNIFRAGLDIASDLDAGIGTGIEDGYHNRRHFMEVMMNVTHLMLRNNAAKHNSIIFTGHERGKVLFAAIAHDFHYERGGNRDADGNPVPYRLEKIAFSKAEPYLKKYGVISHDVADIRVLIYGTDVSPASRAGMFISEMHQHVFENHPKPDVSRVIHPVCRVLDSERLLRMAGLLLDADILASAGLTYDYNRMQSRRLGIEWGKPTGPEDTLVFLNIVAGNRFTTEAARFFQPNMNVIKQQAERDLLLLDGLVMPPRGGRRPPEVLAGPRMI